VELRGDGGQKDHAKQLIEDLIAGMYLEKNPVT
jgi:hypothetical protein